MHDTKRTTRQAVSRSEGNETKRNGMQEILAPHPPVRRVHIPKGTSRIVYLQDHIERFQFRSSPFPRLTWRDTALGLLRSQSHRREHALDDVGTPDVLPVCRRHFVETEQSLFVALQTRDGLWIFLVKRVDEQPVGLQGCRLIFCHVDVADHALCPSMQALGHLVQHVEGFVDPASLNSGCGEHLGKGFPEAKCPIGNRQLRIDLPAPDSSAPAAVPSSSVRSHDSHRQRPTIPFSLDNWPQSPPGCRCVCSSRRTLKYTPSAQR